MNIRGFLAVLSILAGVVVSHSAAYAQQATVPPLFAVLLGGNEVSANGAANAGDPNGRGSATVTITGRTLCFGILVDNIGQPTLAHIHRGVAGTNGPIVVPFNPPASGNPGSSSNCISNLDRNLLDDIQSHASRYYVNVHTRQFPSGAVRGQLF
jgi:hypothetical protein